MMVSYVYTVNPQSSGFTDGRISLIEPSTISLPMRDGVTARGRRTRLRRVQPIPNSNNHCGSFLSTPVHSTMHLRSVSTFRPSLPSRRLWRRASHWRLQAENLHRSRLTSALRPIAIPSSQSNSMLHKTPAAPRLERRPVQRARVHRDLDQGRAGQ
ncbi:hypothetical protein P170DRAFT_114811 [Aspergillus steynii IBT 23096]|uniref:Uncharacterized protein n=1 Tax=Aspergillus steynii IBT 23096 TaxID=1392250 RepID=A0A2I2GJ44_9EURO|nr:uncharacterized protein P170DRAFT_114811 [Aspergillus steynii IBT 23096]PLB52857.1 hypothetical protein P170DRAFT_114811 [Aspergillus steynii IBT 23096]